MTDNLPGPQASDHSRTASIPPEQRQMPQWLRLLAAGNPAVWNLCQRPDGADRQVRDHLRDLEAWVEPIDPKALGVVLKRLSLHYPMPPMTNTERRFFWEDYRRDLGHLPHDLVEWACDNWRRDPERRFFPRTGELLEMTEWRLKNRQQHVANLKAWLEARP